MVDDEVQETLDGCIHSIRVKNFFCHENLEIQFNNNVNFIVGRNGSGKSAILTALVVGLGGRASATNRGNSLTSFIKKGANSTSIEIKIKNSSRYAYKHDIYGDLITIVRNINSSGGSSYKIKSATGELKSTRFADVEAIVIAHNIQVNNPISVLNQDDARSFHSADAKKKYALFRRATSLDQMEQNYHSTIENCNEIKKRCQEDKKAYETMEKEYKKWNTIYENMHSQEEIEEKQKVLQNEFYWSNIISLEKEVATMQAQNEKQKARVDKLMEKLNKIEQNFGNDIIDQLKASIAEQEAAKSQLEEQLRAEDSACREATAAKRAAAAAAGKQRDLAAREARKVADLERAIQNIDSETEASRRAALTARAEAAREALAAAAARHDTARHEADQARLNATHHQAQADEAAQNAQRHREKLKQLKQQVRELESRGSDSLAVFGPQMPELVRRVQACKEFSEPPRGPIGSYLKVKERSWSGALEHLVGGSLTAFAVATAADSRKLFQIMGQVYGRASKPSVTCSKFLTRVHDVRANKVSARGFTCALDALQIADPVVANYLIDNLGLESVLLVPTHEEAMRLSDTRENVPENCKKIVTMDSSEYYPAPDYRSYGGGGGRGRFLSVSTAERKTQLLAEISEAEASLRDLEVTSEAAAAAAREAREAERQAGRALHAAMAARQGKQQEARVAEEALQHHHAPQCAVLMDELRVSEEKVASLEAAVVECAAKEAEARARLESHEARLREVKGKLAAVNARYRDHSEELEQEQLKLDRGAMERRSLKKRVDEEKGKLDTAEAALEEKMEKLREDTDGAERLCPRVENARPAEVVTSELSKTARQLNNLLVGGLSKAEVAAKVHGLLRQRDRAANNIREFDNVLEKMFESVPMHTRYRIKLQDLISKKVQVFFQYTLKVRGYSGKMDIDHARGCLEVSCAGRDAARAAATTASLSGGERSYSTVAFIMSLWDSVELPFFFMDEFDVFMDDVHRKVVLELLMDYAARKASHQFVLLTPQDTAVQGTDTVSIHRMADPRP